MKKLHALGFVVCAALIVAARVHTYYEPLERDITTYAVVAHSWLRGKALYAEIWDHKPPLVFMTFALAELVAGYGRLQIFLIGAGSALGTLFFLMAAGSRLAGAYGALAAGAVWALSASDLLLQANQPNVESLLNLSVAAVFYGWLLLEETRRPRRLAVGVGVLIGLAMLYKPVCGALLIFLPAAHVAGSGDRQRAREQSALCFAGAAAVGGLTLLMWALSGHFAAFWDAVVGYNRVYGQLGMVRAGEIALRERLIPRRFGALALLLPLLPLALLRGWRAGRRREVWLLAALAVSTEVAIAMPGWSYLHYYQLRLPVLALAAAWACALPIRFSLRVLRPALAAFTIGTLLWREAPFFSLSATEWSVRKYGKVFVTSELLVEPIRSLLAPGESFYEWGAETGLYFHTGQVPVGTFFYHYPLLFPGRSAEYARQLRAELEKAKPELVIVNRDVPLPPDDLIPGPHLIVEWIAAHYRAARLVEGEPSFLLLARADGELWKRLNARMPGSSK